MICRAYTNNTARSSVWRRGARSYCHSDRVRGTCTCSCPYSAYTSDRIHVSSASRHLCDTSSSDRVRGYLTCRGLRSAGFKRESAEAFKEDTLQTMSVLQCRPHLQ